MENKIKIPATELQNESGKWERPLTCCAVEAVEDSVADQDYSSEPETILTERIEQEVEDLSESSDDEPAEDSDRMPGDDGSSSRSSFYCFTLFLEKLLNILYKNAEITKKIPTIT